jgi:hypothetical protein
MGGFTGDTFERVGVKPLTPLQASESAAFVQRDFREDDKLGCFAAYPTTREEPSN